MGMNAAIRPAVPDDGAAVLSLAKAFWAEDDMPSTPAQARALAELVGGSPAGAIYVIEAGGEAVGYAILTWGYTVEFAGMDAFLDEIYVAPEFRGRGLGSEAIAVLENSARERGCCALHLEVFRDKTAQARLYRRLGFQARDSIFMSKPLS